MTDVLSPLPLAEVGASGCLCSTLVNGVSPWTLLCLLMRSGNLKIGVD